MSAGYSGKPLVEKLGIKPTSTIVLRDAPDGAERLLEPLPTGAACRRGNRGARETTIWFVTSRRELERRFARVASAVADGTLWSGLRLTRRRS